MPIEYPTHPDIPTSHLPFSPVTRVGNLLFVSGQASVNDQGQIVPDTFEGQMRRSMENLRRILEGAGSSLAQVVQIRSYVHDPANLALYNQLYREYFTAPYPARTTLTSCLTEQLAFEIDCVAVVE